MKAKPFSFNADPKGFGACVGKGGGNLGETVCGAGAAVESSPRRTVRPKPPLLTAVKG